MTQLPLGINGPPLSSPKIAGHQWSELSQLSPLGLAVVDHLDPQLLELLTWELSQQHPVLATARQLQLLVELWKHLELGPEKLGSELRSN